MAGTDPRKMLHILQAKASERTLWQKMLHALHGKASERKLWLFACACCRLTWHLLPELCHRLVEEVERFADKQSRPRELVALFDEFYPHDVDLPAVAGSNQAAEAVGHLGWQWRWRVSRGRLTVGYSVSRSAAESLAKSIPWQEARSLEGQLLLDIFANPFRPLPVLDPSWTIWHGGLVVSMARRMYDSRDFSDMPVLADALEEAGCTNADILGHCRSGGEHVRGCWVVDLILSKQ